MAKAWGRSPKVDAFTHAYIEAALWSSMDDEGAPLDKNHGNGDIAPETLEKMERDADSFQKENWEYISRNLEQAGHDFWLTRNGHGAGFTDGDWGDKPEYRLDKSAQSYGEYNLYVGDDGLIYGA